jgi:DNA-binding response OmpR family regulator
MLHRVQLKVGPVLVLEDEPFIALDVEDVLNDVGFHDVRTLSSCSDAQSWLVDENPALAIVDPHLRDGMCGAVARALAEKNIPFVVYSGDMRAVTEQEPAFGCGVWLSKPSLSIDIVAAIKKALGER